MGGPRGHGRAGAARLFNRPSGRGRGEGPPPRRPPPRPPGHWRRPGTSRPLPRMRSVSSKMYRMKQCALRPRPACPAPPSPAACFRDLHLETRANAASRERHSDRRPGRRSKDAEPGPGRGRMAGALGCGGGAEAAGTGRPGSGEKEVRAPHPSACPGAASCSPGRLTASLGSSKGPNSSSASEQLLNLVNVCQRSF